MVTDADILLQAFNNDDVIAKYIDKINAITKQYPYFYTAWATSSRYLKLRNTFLSPRLQQTAVRSIDRSLLFEFINKKNTTKPQAEKPKETPLKTPVKPVDNELVPVSTKETVKKEEQVKKEKLVENKVEKEKVINKTETNKLNKPVKIIRPIPRVITNATPKKLIKSPVKKDEKLSYSEWLQRIKKEKKKKRKSNIDLIEKFLKERPKIVPKKNVSIKTPEIIEESVSEKQMLMTETLANLYVKQKKYEKAIQAFHILSLKYPKKSSYFANQIKEIKQKLK